MKNFHAGLVGLKIAASASGTAGASQTKTELPATLGDDLLVVNPGANHIFVNVGDDEVAASAGASPNMIVPAGQSRALRLRSADTHIAALSAGVAHDYYIYRGEGQV